MTLLRWVLCHLGVVLDPPAIVTVPRDIGGSWAPVLHVRFVVAVPVEVTERDVFVQEGPEIEQ